ncbi:MAG: carboxypeptidase-like regulatory domain-containing protein [Dysgonamonadaceae bacterium]|jgi:hypothetical protein|nr:carboxypeptidase-like regulatory domain-containing protein [Dysgonamonadaceae bacterium]
MKRFALIFAVALSVLPQLLYPQTVLQGNIQDRDNNPIANVNIIVKGTYDDKIYAFAASDKEGRFSLKLNASADDKLIVFKRLGYNEKIIEINGLSFPLTVRLETGEVLLKEVTITPKSIVVRGDTTEYLVSAFSDGDEKVMEDVLKKMPGIDVSDEGEIKFKGKTISKILLDGTDMFDNQYKIASKNIPANFTATVQAIEHYHENRLLKDTEYSEDVVLNFNLHSDLKMQRPKGQANIGGGWENRYEADATAISMNKYLKLMDKFNLSNTGFSSTSSFTPADITLDDYLDAEAVGDMMQYGNRREQVKSIDGRQAYNSLHFGWQAKPELQITGQLVFNKLHNRFSDSDKTLYFDDSLSIERSSLLAAKPQTLYGNLKMKYDINENFVLTYNGKYDADSKLNSNQLAIPELYSYSANSKNRLQSNNLELTVAMKNKSALQLNVFYLSDCNSQLFNYLQTEENENIIAQNTSASTSRFEATATYLKKNRKNFYYTLKSGYKSDKQDFNADYNQNNAFATLDCSLAFVQAEMTVLYKKATFNIHTLTGYRQQVIDSRELALHTDKRFVFEPALTFSIKQKNSTIFLSGSYRQINYDPNDYVAYFTSYRTFKNPAAQYAINSIYSLSTTYNYFNLSNGTSLTAFYSYYISDRPFAYRTDISVLMNINSPILAKNTKTHIGNLSVKKYIDAVRHGINYSGTVYSASYQNAVNSAQLRDNDMFSHSSKISLKSVFDFPVNYMAGISINYSSVKTETNPRLSAVNYSLFQDLLYKSGKNLTVKISFDEHFLGRNRKMYFFAMPVIEWNIGKYDLKVGVSAYNILNNRQITDYQLTDISESEVGYSIVPAQYLLNLQFRF